jgi:hypothetical protein
MLFFRQYVQNLAKINHIKFKQVNERLWTKQRLVLKKNATVFNIEVILGFIDNGLVS